MPLAAPASSPKLRRTLGVLAAAALLAGLGPMPAGAVGITRLELVQQSVKTSGQSFVTGFGLRAHLAGGDLNEPFEIVPAIEHWQKITRLPELGVPEARQGDWRIGADLRYRFGDNPGWTPYVGAGLALDIVSAHVEVGPEFGPITVRENSGNKLAPNFLLGIDLPETGPIRSAFEFSYNLVPDLKQFKINFGFGYQFGKHGEPIKQ